MSDQVDLKDGGTVTRSRAGDRWRFEFFGRPIGRDGVEVEMTLFERCAVIRLLGGEPTEEMFRVVAIREPRSKATTIVTQALEAFVARGLPPEKP